MFTMYANKGANWIVLVIAAVGDTFVNNWL